MGQGDDLKYTVLYREHGVWQDWEIGRLTTNLPTGVFGQADCPHHLILSGHFTKKQVLAARGDGFGFEVTQVTGYDNPELPFRPSI